MPLDLSVNVASLQPSATMAVAARAKELAAAGADIVDLCVGEPDFPTPAFIADAGIAAIRAGRTTYTPAAGLPQLRAAIAADVSRLSASGFEMDPAGVVVSCGAKQALFNVTYALFGPGDRVLVPVPYWTTYPELVRIAGAEPVFVPTSAENGYRATVADLERAAAGGPVHGVMLNTPTNPSGAVYPLDELRGIAEWTSARDAWLISDEIYRRISFTGTIAPGVLDLPHELLERAIVIDGASKAFAMTGWRLGYSCSSPALAKTLVALQSQTTSNAPAPSQWAALAAYSQPAAADAEVERMRAAFERRRDLLVGLFRDRLPDVPLVPPEGAFYLWIGTRGLARDGEGSMALSQRLLDDAGVALVPGIAFGDDAHLRISFAYPEATLEAAVDRIARFVG